MPRLPAPTEARYRITWDGRQVGRERVRVDIVEDRWVMVGTSTQTEPLELLLTYRVELERASREPLSFRVVIRLAGERMELSGRRSTGDFELDRTVLGRNDEGRAPYGGGTVLELGSPLASWWAWALLFEQVEPQTSADVRTLFVQLPELVPRVGLQTFRRALDYADVLGPQGRRTRYRSSGSGAPPTVEIRQPGWTSALRWERVTRPEEARIAPVRRCSAYGTSCGTLRSASPERARSQP